MNFSFILGSRISACTLIFAAEINNLIFCGMKKTVFFIAFALVAIMCWNWLLDSRSLTAFVAFFSSLSLIIGLIPTKEESK